MSERSTSCPRGAFEAALEKARREHIPVMALRHDLEGLDDVVVESPAMFRAEMMSRKELWMCCYFQGDNGQERVTFWVRARKGRLEFSVTEEPPKWIDWDRLRASPSDPLPTVAR